MNLQCSLPQEKENPPEAVSKARGAKVEDWSAEDVKVSFRTLQLHLLIPSVGLEAWLSDEGLDPGLLQGGQGRVEGERGKGGRKGCAEDVDGEALVELAALREEGSPLYEDALRGLGPRQPRHLLKFATLLRRLPKQ